MGNETFIRLLDLENPQEILNSLASLPKLLSEWEKADLRICYSEDEVCKMFNVSKSKLRKYRQEGKLGFVKPDPDGRVILYTKKHIEKFLNDYEYVAFKK